MMASTRIHISRSVDAHISHTHIRHSSRSQLGIVSYVRFYDNPLNNFRVRCTSGIVDVDVDDDGHKWSID